MAQVMHQIGPFVAIGKPGEPLPELGAARLYVSDDEWQSKVETLLSKSRLIIMRLGKTPGFWWEFERLMQTIPLQKVIFYVVPGSEHRYPKLRDGLRDHGIENVPEALQGARFLSFVDKDAGITPTRLHTRLRRLYFLAGLAALEDMYITALAPVIKQSGAEVPKSRFFRSALITVAVALLFLLSVVLVQYYIAAQLEGAQVAATEANMSDVRTQLEQQRMDSGEFPAGLDELKMKPSRLLDGWGHRLEYEKTPGGFRLRSLGSDGIEGGEGDGADIVLE